MGRWFRPFLVFLSSSSRVSVPPWFAFLCRTRQIARAPPPFRARHGKLTETADSYTARLPNADVPERKPRIRCPCRSPPVTGVGRGSGDSGQARRPFTFHPRQQFKSRKGTQPLGRTTARRVATKGKPASRLAASARSKGSNEQGRRRHRLVAGRAGARRRGKGVVRLLLRRQGRGNAQMKDLLGGKGANLADMTVIVPLPVPPGVHRHDRHLRRLQRRRRAVPRRADGRGPHQRRQGRAGHRQAASATPQPAARRRPLKAYKMSMPGMMDGAEHRPERRGRRGPGRQAAASVSRTTATAASSTCSATP